MELKDEGYDIEIIGGSAALEGREEVERQENAIWGDPIPPVGTRIICQDGIVWTKQNDGKYVKTGQNRNYVRMREELIRASQYKENTAFKIIERTAKRDAYSTVLRHMERVLNNAGNSDSVKLSDVSRVLSYIKEKRDAHRKYTGEQSTWYDYATQTFIPRAPSEAHPSQTDSQSKSECLSSACGQEPSAQS